MEVVAFFLVPEMKGRTLEEVDQLFEMKTPLRQFRSTATDVSVRANKVESLEQEADREGDGKGGSVHVDEDVRSQA